MNIILISCSQYQVIEGNSTDQSITNELGKIKHSFSEIQRLITINELVPNIVNETIKKRFENSVHDKVNQLQKVFIEFVDKPDVTHKQILSQTCNDTNGKNDVLTSLHNEIVNGGNATLNELLPRCPQYTSNIL